MTNGISVVALAQWAIPEKTEQGVEGVKIWNFGTVALSYPFFIDDLS